MFADLTQAGESLGDQPDVEQGDPVASRKRLG